MEPARVASQVCACHKPECADAFALSKQHLSMLSQCQSVHAAVSMGSALLVQLLSWIVP